MIWSAVLLREGIVCLLVGGNGFQHWIDVYTTTIAVETNHTIGERKNRVITSQPDVFAGMKLGATLAQDDVARHDGFTAKFFDAETLADAVAAVLNAALSFFMCHDVLKK